MCGDGVEDALWAAGPPGALSMGVCDASCWQPDSVAWREGSCEKRFQCGPPPLLLLSAMSACAVEARSLHGAKRCLFESCCSMTEDEAYFSDGISIAWFALASAPKAAARDGLCKARDRANATNSASGSLCDCQQQGTKGQECKFEREARVFVRKQSENGWSAYQG